MKKFTFLSFSILSAVICLSNLDGSFPGNTNAPGEFTCGRAPCHNVPDNVGDAEMSITFGNEETEYFPDGVFPLKVKITNPMTNRNGFEILALDENLENAGTWELTEPEQMKIISGFSNPNKKYVTHQAPGNQQEEWVMNWKAPAEDVGQVTFYASVLSANDNGANTGDEVYFTNIGIDFGIMSDISEKEVSSVIVYPVLSNAELWMELPQSKGIFDLNLYNLMGIPISQKQSITGGMQFLDINNVTSGLYFLRVENGIGEVEVISVFVP